MRKLSIIAVMAAVIVFSGCSKEEKPREGYSFTQEWAEIKIDKKDNFTGDLTIDVYIKMESYPKDWTPIISKMVSRDSSEFSIRIKGEKEGRWSYAVNGKRYNLVFSPQKTMPLNKWVRFTAVRSISKKTMTLYVDGKRIANKRFAEMEKPGLSEKNILLLSDGKRTINASISELRFWNKALSNNELEKSAKLLENPSKLKNLVGYWQFPEKMETVPTDQSKFKRTISLKKIAVKKQTTTKQNPDKLKSGSKTKKQKETKKLP